VREAAGDGGAVCVAVDEGRHVVLTVRPRELVAAVEDHVLGVNRFDDRSIAGVRAQRMRGQQVVDLEAVLDDAYPIL
jgi:hypothetical protein